MTIRLILIFLTFSLGKIIGATGQTVFSVNHAFHYAFKNINIEYWINCISIFAAGCTLLVIVMTRVPAIYRQLTVPIKQQTISNILNAHDKKFFYRILINCNIISGFFSSIGAYFGALIIIEVVLNIENHSITAKEIIFYQTCAILVAISSFVSYYSFNIPKAKLNSIKFIDNLRQKNFKFIMNKHGLKTCFVSLLNVLSVPFIAYFLTKNAIYKMPYISTHLSSMTIQWIAAFSSITALIASLTTTVPALHAYFNKNEMEYSNQDSVFWKILRYMTYSAGFVDSGASGLGNFLGVILISHDVFNISLYNNYIILFAIGCGLSAMSLNLSFSIRQGFNETLLQQGSIIPHLRYKQMLLKNWK